jgi:hypothetical protein
VDSKLHTRLEGKYQLMGRWDLSDQAHALNALNALVLWMVTVNFRIFIKYVSNTHPVKIT